MKANKRYAANNGSEIFMYMDYSCINHAVIFKRIECEVVENLHTDLYDEQSMTALLLKLSIILKN